MLGNAVLFAISNDELIEEPVHLHDFADQLLTTNELLDVNEVAIEVWGETKQPDQEQSDILPDGGRLHDFLAKIKIELFDPRVDAPLFGELVREAYHVDEAREREGWLEKLSCSWLERKLAGIDVEVSNPFQRILDSEFQVFEMRALEGEDHVEELLDLLQIHRLCALDHYRDDSRAKLLVVDCSIVPKTD